MARAIVCLPVVCLSIPIDSVSDSIVTNLSLAEVLGSIQNHLRVKSSISVKSVSGSSAIRTLSKPYAPSSNHDSSSGSGS
jgi:hypothetical protein